MTSMMAVGGVLRASMIHSSPLLLAGWLLGCLLVVFMPAIGIGRLGAPVMDPHTGQAVGALSPTGGILTWYGGVIVLTAALCSWMLYRSVLAASMRPVMTLVSRGAMGEKPRMFLPLVVADFAALSITAGLLIAGLLRALLWHSVTWSILGVGMVLVAFTAFIVALIGWLLDKKASSSDDAAQVDLWSGLTLAQGCEALEHLYARQAGSELKDFYASLNSDGTEPLHEMSAKDRSYVIDAWTAWAIERDNRGR